MFIMGYNPDHILIIMPSLWSLSWWLVQKHLLWNSLGSLPSLDGLWDCWRGSLHLHAAQCLVVYYLPRLPTLGTLFVMNQLPNKFWKRNWNMLWSQFPDTNTKCGSPWPTQLLLHCQTECHPMQGSRVVLNLPIAVSLQVSLAKNSQTTANTVYSLV